MYIRTILPLVLFAVSATAADPLRSCQKVSGVTTETILPPEAAPNDPFGRVAGTFTGSLGGASTAAVTAILASPPAFSAGGLATATAIQVKQAWITAPGDVFTTSGKAYFNVAPGMLPGDNASNPSKCPGVPCVVQVPQTLTITGGTGRWTGASGELRNVGLGNLNLPQGQGVFTLNVSGEICVPSGSLSASGKAGAEY